VFLLELLNDSPIPIGLTGPLGLDFLNQVPQVGIPTTPL
jgi:hypothetical protein